MEEEQNNLFPVKLINPTNYPVRTLVWMDEDTGKSKFKILKQFEQFATQINKLTYDHLRLDPKIKVIADVE